MSQVRSMANRRKEAVEVSANADCPCGSGKKYGRCCKRRKFSWAQYPDGTLAKSIPISDELGIILKSQEAEFIETFGRKPRKGDPVFFQTFYISNKDLERETLKAMKAASTPPPLVYAYRKTGRIVTTGNKSLLTPRELEEWQDAIDEYYAAVEIGQKIDLFNEDDEFTGFLKDAIRKNQIVGGSFIDKHFNNYQNRNGSVAEIETIVGFATTNFVRCLKSIYVLIEENAAFDAYHLLRSMYENYLTAKYTYANPNACKAFSAQIGVFAGTHKFAESSRGVPRQSEIIELKTGEKISVPSRWHMATALGAMDVNLYNSMYRTLSSYAHSEITTIRHFISERGYDYQRNEFTFDILINCHILCLLFFFYLSQHSPCFKYLRRDLSINVERSFLALSMVQKMLTEEGGRLPDVYNLAISEVVASDPRLSRIAEAVANTALARVDTG